MLLRGYLRAVRLGASQVQILYPCLLNKFGGVQAILGILDYAEVQMHENRRETGGPPIHFRQEEDVS